MKAGPALAGWSLKGSSEHRKMICKGWNSNQIFFLRLFHNICRICLLCRISQKGLIPSSSFLAEDSAPDLQMGRAHGWIAAVIHKSLILSRKEKGIQMILYILNVPCGKWRDH